MKWYYLMLDLLSISFPLIRSFEPKIRFSSKWKFLFPGMLIAGLVYIPWDIWFTVEGIWGFNQDYLLGITFLHLPLEEWLFFIVIPYACFFIFEVSVYFFKLKEFKTAPVYHGLIALALLVLGYRHMEHTYTSIACWGAALSLLIANVVIRQARWSYFWAMYGISLVPFLIVNGALTGAFTEKPVVWYNNTENSGVRLGTIPIEDSVYLLFYLLLIFMVYETLYMRSLNKSNKSNTLEG
jgi:lycopene cyclase domain-containing protein